MRQSRYLLLGLCLGLLLGVQAAQGQSGSTVLQIGTPIERTLTAGQSHRYTINLEEAQIAQLVVDQRGIDVIVRVFSPGGRRLGEFDTPNGTQGPENVTVIAETAGAYRIEVAPLSGYENPSGRYEIKVVEIRKATEQELQSIKSQDVTKAKGLALLSEATQNFPQLRRPQTRAAFQIKAAQMLWTADEKRASKLMEQAIESVKEFIANVDESDQSYYENFQTANQLRRQVVEALGPHDPDLALSFLRATRTLTNPDRSQGSAHVNEELQLELSLASQITAADPKRAFQIAEDTLKNGYATSVVDTIHRLRSKDPELAATLAHDIAAKLTNESLLRIPEAGYLASSLLYLARTMRRPQMGAGDGTANSELISEDDYRDLFQKVVAETLSYSPPGPNFYSPERNAAQNLANMLKQMKTDLQSYAPERVAAVEKKWTELNNTGGVQAEQWQKYQTAINEGAIDVESVKQAPREMQDQLYQQIANKAAAAGDPARARQLLIDHITNPMQRQQALNNLDQQAIFGAMGRGKVDEALRILGAFRPANERAAILAQIVNQIGPGLKRSAAVAFLEQARSMIGPTAQAEDQRQMHALFEIARAFSRFDSTRAFEIVEPLIDQFNELCTAAATMDGFGQKYFQDGEVIMQNGNSLGEAANQLGTALGNLALVNFERAKAAADRIRLVDVRMQAYLDIAQQTIQGDKNTAAE